MQLTKAFICNNVIAKGQRGKGAKGFIDLAWRGAVCGGVQDTNEGRRCSVRVSGLWQGRQCTYTGKKQSVTVTGGTATAVNQYVPRTIAPQG
jgi:hypothetical protein